MACSKLSDDYVYIAARFNSMPYAEKINGGFVNSGDGNCDIDYDILSGQISNLQGISSIRSSVIEFPNQDLFGFSAYGNSLSITKGYFQLYISTSATWLYTSLNHYFLDFQFLTGYSNNYVVLLTHDNDIKFIQYNYNGGTLAGSAARLESESIITTLRTSDNQWVTSMGTDYLNWKLKLSLDCLTSSSFNIAITANNRLYFIEWLGTVESGTGQISGVYDDSNKDYMILAGWTSYKSVFMTYRDTSANQMFFGVYMTCKAACKSGYCGENMICEECSDDLNALGVG